MNSFKVTESNLLWIIQSLDCTKAHGYDNLSVRIKKICSELAVVPQVL